MEKKQKIKLKVFILFYEPKRNDICCTNIVMIIAYIYTREL